MVLIQPQFANDAPKSTMHERTGDPFGVNSASPGPAAYNPDYNATKPKAGASSMHIRPADKAPESSVGYYDIKSGPNGPFWTIGNREELDLCPI